MALPYENSTSGDKALAEIEKCLRRFGCTKFGSWMDYADAVLTVQFECRGRPVQVSVSGKGYAAAWLREHPYNPSRSRKTQAQHERQAFEQGMVAIYSILRDWIKGQVVAIETGVLSFEGAFLGQMMLPSGVTVLDHIQQQRLLPSPAAAEAAG